jgi:hypothetical protein
LDFVEDLEAARNRGRLQYLLELLGGAHLPADPADVANYIAALGTFADSLHIGEGLEEADSYRRQTERLIFRSLGEHDVPERTWMLIRACEMSGSIWFPVAFEAHFRTEEPAAITDDGKIRLRELAKQRIATAGERLARHPALGELLVWWLENGDEQAVREYVAGLLRADDTILNLIYAFSQPRVANIGKAQKRREGLHTFVDELSRFVSIDAVLARINELDQAKLTPQQRDLFRSLRDEAARKVTRDIKKQQDS